MKTSRAGLTRVGLDADRWSWVRIRGPRSRRAIGALLVLFALGAGVGGYLVGSSSDVDLETARLAAAEDGREAGARVGEREGYQRGYRTAGSAHITLSTPRPTGTHTRRSSSPRAWIHRKRSALLTADETRVESAQVPHGRTRMAAHESDAWGPPLQHPGTPGRCGWRPAERPIRWAWRHPLRAVDSRIVVAVLTFIVAAEFAVAGYVMGEESRVSAIDAGAVEAWHFQDAFSAARQDAILQGRQRGIEAGAWAARRAAERAGARAGARRGEAVVELAARQRERRAAGAGAELATEAPAAESAPRPSSAPAPAVPSAPPEPCFDPAGFPC